MLHRKCLASLAAAALLACGSLVRADQSGGSTPLYADGSAATEPATAPAPPATAPKPLMLGLEAIGVGKALEDANISIGGFVEGSWTYSASNPPGGIITGRVFDFEQEDVTLNQLDLQIARTIDASKGKFDVGFMIEGIYGGDARLIHSNGFDFYGNGAGPGEPDEQIDIVQAYLQVAIPVGKGLTIQAGKFVTLLGEETINPTTNPLYSHSYLFGFAIPFTNTGILASYPVTDKITVTAGVTRGWEQALKDNNNAADGIGEIKYVISDKLTLIVNAISGPEEAADSSDYRTVIDGIVTYAMSDQVTLSLNADFGYEADVPGVGDAVWYGAAVYGGYKINDMFTVNARGEYFNDEKGARGLGSTVYEATLGVAVHPVPNDKILSNLVFRPEVRYDYSDQGIFDGGTNNYQFSAAVDAIFTF